MGQTNCGNCGAPTDGRICEYCGSALISLESREEQMSALFEFHEALQAAEKEQQVRLLRGGYVPGDPEVLIEAGMRLLPLIDMDGMDEEPGASATTRLMMVKTKLELCEQEPRTVAAVTQFDKIINKRTRVSLVQIFGALIIFLTVIGAVLYMIFG